ncbi:MAG: low molecular weight phosphatase family protein [Alphaproteobacteria bacterium]
MMSLPSAVLFACTNNIIRSPMAEALLRYLHGRRIHIDSCGIRRGDEIDPFVIDVMEELGIDISAHQPNSFDDLEDSYFDLIISLSPEAHHRAMEMTRTMACDVEFWPTFDPTMIDGNRGQRLEAYREVRDGLFRRLRDRFPLIGASIL